jgi:YHS domain-containing protein
MLSYELVSQRPRYFAMVTLTLGFQFAIATFISLALAPAVLAANEMCPVIPTEKALPELKTDHNGRTIHFCCEGCVQKFKANPSPYLANLPPDNSSNNVDMSRIKPPPPNPPIATGLEWLEPVFKAVDFLERHQPLSIYIAGAGLLVMMAMRIRNRRAKRENPGRIFRWLEPLSRHSTLVILVLLGVCGELWRLTALAEAEAEQTRNNATEQVNQLQEAISQAHAQGASTSNMLTWAWPQALHELPKGLKNTYYRGNDERSPKLFNGGNYRTATFHVSVRTPDGRDVTPGMNLAGQVPRVRLEIVRAPNTAPNFFTADQMSNTFLIPLDDPQADPAALSTVTPEQHWVAEAPFGRPGTEKGYTRLNRVWCVCVGVPKPRLSSAQIHYYIQCVMHTQDGVVQPESSAWMISVYPSPILHTATADQEWFSDRPIPEIPNGKNATDPKLLGISKPDAKP